MFCTGHLIGWIWKCWNLLFQFCLLIGFHCQGGPSFSKRNVILQDVRTIDKVSDRIIWVWQFWCIHTSVLSWMTSLNRLDSSKHVSTESGLSLGDITHSTCYRWVCLISPLCYGWNCQLLIELNLTVTSLLWIWRKKAICNSQLNDSPACLLLSRPFSMAINCITITSVNMNKGFWMFHLL